MKERNWSYLAGLFDGEGSVSLSKHFDAKGYPSFVFTIQITNTSLVLMKWLVSTFGGVYYTNTGKRPDNWKQSYMWRVKGRKNEEAFLLGVLPYLIIKHEQAKIALEFVRMFQVKDHEKRCQLAERLQDLNRRGKSVETNTLDTEEDFVKRESVPTGDCGIELTVT